MGVACIVWIPFPGAEEASSSHGRLESIHQCVKRKQANCTRTC